MKPVNAMVLIVFMLCATLTGTVLLYHHESETTARILGIIAIGMVSGGLVSALLNRYLSKPDPFMCGCGHHAAFHEADGEGPCIEKYWHAPRGYSGAWQNCFCIAFQPKGPV